MARASRSLASTAAPPLRLRLFGWLRPWTSRAPTLDPETLPDSLRRDLGLTDGRAASPRDPWRD